MAEAPNIFAFHDYRLFLKEFVAWKQTSNPGFSLRLISKRAGFDAPNYMGLVIRGKRNLGAASIRQVARVLGFKKDELDYFVNMVLMNQATTSDEKNFYYKRMSSSKKYLEVHQLERDQYEFYSKWHYTVVRELVSLLGFREDPAWIARRVKPRISIEEAKATIEFLLKIKLIERGPDGKLRQVTPHLSTPAGVASLSVANFHREMIDRAKEAVDSTPSAHRDISSLTIALPPDKIQYAREKIRAFRRELHAILASSSEGDGHAICQINFQLFTLSEVGNA